MKKKIDWTTTIFIAVIAILIGFGIYSSLDKKEDKNTIAETVAFDAKNQPTLGSKSAPIEIIEFGDYACIHCQSWTNDIFPDLKKDYIDTEKVRFTFINYAFLGATSTYAASAAEYVYATYPESFWDFHEGLYDISPVLTENNLVKLAKSTIPNLDEKAFKASLDEQSHLSQVNADLTEVNKRGVTSTPTLFVNDTAVTNAFEYSEIEKAIKAAEDSND